jgi:hypothetical protein
MAQRKLTVTLPDGTTASRRTDRDYGFVVAVSPRDSTTLAQLADREADEAEALAERLEAMIAEPVLKLRPSGYSRPGMDPDKNRDGSPRYTSHEALLVGAEHAMTRANAKGETETWGVTADGTEGRLVVSALAYLVERTRDRADRQRTEAAAKRAEAEALRAGSTDAVEHWAVARWSTRQDLAEKAITGDLRKLSALGHELRVLSVDLT